MTIQRLQAILDPALGAKLGAVLCGQHRTDVGAFGLGCLHYQAQSTHMDVCGHPLEIYGSEGWGFKSSRARQARSPAYG
jgi:hypothetical protein